MRPRAAPAQLLTEQPIAPVGCNPVGPLAVLAAEVPSDHTGPLAVAADRDAEPSLAVDAAPAHVAPLAGLHV